jgi:hypothetical protein
VRTAWWVAAWVAQCTIASHVSARAVVTLEKRGSAWNDTTPAEPVGGNSGTTLGEQRTIAVERAAAIWAEHLDSPVPIAVQVTFDDLGCTEQGAVLGQAGSYGGVSGLRAEGADPSLWYPSALANRLAGRDLLPGEPDILLELNSSLDRGLCLQELGGYYYGLDARAGVAGLPDSDLVETIVHELGHGLGFASFVDVESGENVLGERSDAFTAQAVERDDAGRARDLRDERAAGRVRWHAHAGRGARVARAGPAVAHAGAGDRDVLGLRGRHRVRGGLGAGARERTRGRGRLAPRVLRSAARRERCGRPRTAAPWRC